MERIGSISQLIGWCAVGLASGSVAIAPPTQAQVIPDNTLPIPSTVEAGCTLCEIEGGTQRGDTLFHSFTEFSVQTEGGALFNNAIEIENIFSRVTGEAVSDIDGLLQTQGTANLFLLNPNGIVFGPNARLEISGSLTASTADSLIFTDGETFSAIDPQAPPLLTASIRPGLQYGRNPGAGAFPNRAITVNQGTLAVGQDLTLTADQLDIQGQLYAGRDLRLIATDRVRLRDSARHPLVIAAEENLWIQGDQAIDIFALNHSESGLFSGADMRLQSDAPVLGDAHYWSGGDFRVATLDNTLGNLASPNDPVIRTLGDVAFDAYIGSSLHILAGGSVEIGTVTIIQPETGADGFLQDTVQLSNGIAVAIDGSAQPTLDIRAGVSPDAIATLDITGVDPGSDIFLNGPNLSSSATRADITVGDVVIPGPDGVVLLTNQYQPNSTVAGGDIAITGNGIFGDGIDVQEIDQQGGSVIVDARDNIFLESGIASSTVLADAGDITLLAENDIALTEGADILASGLSGGNILLQSGGTISATNNTEISSNSTGTTPSTAQGSIALLGESVQLSGEEMFIGSLTAGVREGSPILIQADDTVTVDGSIITATSLGTATGSSGDINIAADRLRIVQGGLVFISAAERSGNINLTVTDSVTIEGLNPASLRRSSLTNTAPEDATSDTGNVSITTSQLTVTDGALLTTRSFGSGDAGDVIIKADAVLFDGVNTQTGLALPTAVFTTSSEGDGGDIQITGRTLSLTKGALFIAITDTTGEGTAGNVILDLTDAVTLEGDSILDSLILNPFSPLLPDGTDLLGSGIFVNTLPGARGDGGNIDITTRNFALSDRAALFASTASSGRSGNVTVDSQTFSIGDGSRISATSTREGEAGNITVRADQFSATEAGVLTTTTQGSRDAGNIELEIRNHAAFSGEGTGLFADTTSGAIGNGGNIRVTRPRQISLEEGATIAASSEGTGVGGNIQLEADILDLNSGASIAATTTSNQGGNIALTLQDGLVLRNGSLISATAGLAQAGGDGGDVNIDAREGFVVAVPTENSDIVADAFEGRGGNIEIRAQGIFGIEPRDRPTPLSDIRASSELGIDGTIQVDTLELDPDRGLTALPSGLLDTAQMLAQGCEPGGADTASQGSFFTSGRGGIVPLATDVLGSDDVVDDLRLPDPGANAASITEAQGWTVNHGGEVVLTAVPGEGAAQNQCWR